MATAQATVVYTSSLAASQSIRGQLFAGKKFWIGQRTPQRSVYVNKVRSNGGDVVPLEKNADYLIYDHLKNDGPTGGISYEFIDHSIRHGVLADPDTFVIGPARGTVRDVGSSRPTKQGRTPFSTQDDAILWLWVRSCEAKGSAIKGNEIYKQLEVNHPNHTWQAWRDRFLKTLNKRPEEWKEDFTYQAQDLLDELNGRDKSVTSPTRTKRARSDEPWDQHRSIKRKRVNDPRGEDAKEELVGDTNTSLRFATSSLQAQARANTQPKTTPPNDASPPSPSSQLFAEQEEAAAQRLSFRAPNTASSQPKDRSSLPSVIDLTGQSPDGSGTASFDEDGIDDLLIPEPEGGFAPETELQTQPKNQTLTQHSSSPPASSWNPVEPIPSGEESEPELDPERAPDPAGYTRRHKDEKAVPDFQTLYTYYKNRGYSDAHIATAFYATSANPDALKPVLEELEAGRGVPPDVKGVWTEDDDKLLMRFEGHWAENIVTESAVTRKHGLTECKWRRAFLETMRLGSGAVT